MQRILFPLPDKNFDVTEAAVPWKFFDDAGVEITFATENGTVAAGDPLLLSSVPFGQYKPYAYVDGELVSARWPKDSWVYAAEYLKALSRRSANAHQP